MTKNEKQVWQTLKDYYAVHDFSFGTGKKVPLENTEENKTFVKKLAKWICSEASKKEHQSFLDKLLKERKGSLHVAENYLWDYLMN